VRLETREERLIYEVFVFTSCKAMISFIEIEEILHSSANSVVAEQLRFRCMVDSLTHVHDLFFFGTWHTPPHWIDSIFHIGGVMINGSDAASTKDYFYVCHSWLGHKSHRIAKSLVAGGIYRSYVRMAAIEEKNMYAGGVNVLQDGVIVAGEDEVPSGATRPNASVLLASDATSSKAAVATSVMVHKASAPTPQPKAALSTSVPAAEPVPASKPSEQSAPAKSDCPIVNDCVRIMARE
jgi:hypothetical protein